MKKALAQVFLAAALAASPSATPSANLAKLPAVHILPDNPLYFLKTLKEQAQLFITRNAKDQSDLLLSFSQERLAEAVKVAEKGKTQVSDKLLEAYGEDIKQAKEKVEQAKAAGEQTHDLLIKLKQTTDYYQSVLARVEKGVPESDKMGLGIFDWLRNVLSQLGKKEVLRPLAE